MLAALIVTGTAPGARGDALSGPLEFQFTDDNQIWDFGSFSDCQDEEGVQLCVALDMVPNAKGNYAGTAQLAFTGAIEGTLTGPATGRIRGKDAGPGGVDHADKGWFRFKADGILDQIQTPLGNTVTDVPATIALHCKGDIADGIYHTTCNVTVKLHGYGSDTARGVPFTAIIDGGDWSVTVNASLTDETHYAGVAFDSLGFSYVVNGTYSPNQDRSNLLLKGLNDDLDRSARIWFKNLVSDAASQAAGDARYKVQGYRGTADVATD